MSEQRLHSQVVPFFGYLKRYASDRGALANLRGALSETRQANAWPLLGGFQHGAVIGNRAFEIVAGLWASDSGTAAASGNLGATLGKLKSDHSSFEGRFKRLLTCDKGEIVDRIVPVVRAAQAKGVSVDYPRLLSDLLWWNDRVQVEWARSFWGTADTPQEPVEDKQ